MQIRKSRETLQLVAPIAHRLGMIEVKHELEELSLRVLRPPASPSAPFALRLLRPPASPSAPFALRLLAFTALVLPRHEQARWREEWHAELSVMPARLQRARFAWQTAVGVPRLAWALRGSRPADAPLWTVSLARIARTLGLTGAVVAFTAPGPAVAWAAGLVALAALGLLGVVLFGRSEVPMARLARLIRAWRGKPPT
jgi:hypothetical protein